MARPSLRWLEGERHAVTSPGQRFGQHVGYLHWLVWDLHWLVWDTVSCDPAFNPTEVDLSLDLCVAADGRLRTDSGGLCAPQGKTFGTAGQPVFAPLGQALRLVRGIGTRSRAARGPMLLSR